jgi:hypothetical protein
MWPGQIAAGVNGPVPRPGVEKDGSTTGMSALIHTRTTTVRGAA